MPDRNRRFLLRERPTGRIGPDTFELVEQPVPEIGDGEALVRLEWISVDPTNRTWIGETPTYLPPVGIGEVMRAGGIGRVVASKHPELPGGPARPGAVGWQDYAVPRTRAGVRVEVAGRLAERLPRRARHDGAHRLRRDARHRQAAAGGDRRRLRRRRRGRLDRRPDREDPTAPASSASPAARRSARC